MTWPGWPETPRYDSPAQDGSQMNLQLEVKASSHDRRCRDDGLFAHMYVREVCRKLCVDAGFKISSWQQCFRSRALRRISVICMRVPHSWTATWTW